MWDAPSCRALPAAADENESSRTQSVVLVGKGVAIPSCGECLQPFLKTAFIEVCTGVYSVHAKLVNQCLKAIVTENRYYL